MVAGATVRASPSARSRSPQTGSAVLTGLSMFGGPFVALLSSTFLLSVTT